MRTKQDPQWSQPSDAPACGRCGLPLLAGTRVCPFCERRVHQGAVARLADQGRRILHPGPEARTIAGIPEPVLLAIAIVVFTSIAITSAVAAVIAA